MEETKNRHLQVFGQNVKYLRMQHGWSQEELADKCGYTSDTRKSTISKIEKGLSDVPISKVKVFAAVFGVSCSDLCDDSKIQQRQMFCELIEQCHGKEAFEAVQTFLKLDDSDRAVVTMMMNSLLSADKYSIKKESRNA